MYLQRVLPGPTRNTRKAPFYSANHPNKKPGRGRVFRMTTTSRNQSPCCFCRCSQRSWASMVRSAVRRASRRSGRFLHRCRRSNRSRPLPGASGCCRSCRSACGSGRGYAVPASSRSRGSRARLHRRCHALPHEDSRWSAWTLPPGPRASSAALAEILLLQRAHVFLFRGRPSQPAGSGAGGLVGLVFDHLVLARGAGAAERAATATATLPTGRDTVFGAESDFTAVLAGDFETGTGFLDCGAFEAAGAAAGAGRPVGLLPLPRSWPGQAWPEPAAAGFGADFTTGAGAGFTAGAATFLAPFFTAAGVATGGHSDLLCYGPGDRLGCSLLHHRLRRQRRRLRPPAGGSFLHRRSLADGLHQRLLAGSGWLGLGGRSDFLRHRLALDRRFLCGGLPGARLRDAAPWSPACWPASWQRALPPTSSQQAWRFLGGRCGLLCSF